MQIIVKQETHDQDGCVMCINQTAFERYLIPLHPHIEAHPDKLLNTPQGLLKAAIKEIHLCGNKGNSESSKGASCSTRVAPDAGGTYHSGSRNCSPAILDQCSAFIKWSIVVFYEMQGCEMKNRGGVLVLTLT